MEIDIKMMGFRLFWKSISALVLLLLVECESSCAVPSAVGLKKTCVEPSEHEQLTSEQYSDTISKQSFSLFPGWQKTGKSLKDIPNEFQDIEIEHFSDAFNCSLSVSRNSFQKERRHRHQKHKMNQLALCPWIFVKNIDKNRKPNVLMEAVCACKYPNSDHSDLFCDNVYQHVTVFRRTGCDGGEYSYQKVWERVSVACVTLSRPKANPSQMNDRQAAMKLK